MNKTILSTFLIMAIFCLNLPGQGDQCPNFKVAISNRNVSNDSTLYYLNKLHNRDLTLDAWISEIDAKFVEELNGAGYNDLDFFSARSNPGSDIDIFFFYDIILWSVNKDSPDNKYADAYFKDGVLYFDNQKIVFRIRSQVDIYSTCIPLMSSPIINEESISDNIFQCVKNVVGLNWPLDRQIWYWESQHLAPARKPEMSVNLGKEFLSLLDQESRKMEVRIKVQNCRGQYVYNQYNGQPVYFLKEIERLEYKDGKKCNIGPDWGLFSTVFTNKEYEAIGEYTVKKGTEPSIEKLRFKTCGIGTNSLIETENEIIIRGLELLVEPWRKTIHNGEQTTISIDLHETDPDGNKYPAENREVQIKVTGLVDGTISPSGKVTTDDMGVAWIDYKAGQEDKQIKITATFTPPGYPEEVKGEETINVKTLEYDATLTLRGSYRKTERNSYREERNDNVADGTYDMTENREASFYVPLKFENAYDVAIQDQRWEFYRPLDINLSNFNASFHSRKYDHADGSGHGFRTTINVNKSPTGQKVSAKDYLLQSNITLIIDKNTGKVVKIATGGFGVEFTLNETSQMTTESWWTPPPYPGHETISNTETKSEDVTFNAQPVEERIPDPTYKNVSESVKKYMKDLGTPLPANIEIPEEKEDIPEVEPDLLVKFGDGKTFFGGKGRKIIDNSEGSFVSREELNFTWQVTRKKKP